MICFVLQEGLRALQYINRFLSTIISFKCFCHSHRKTIQENIIIIVREQRSHRNYLEYATCQKHS